jgi:transposase-like protein
MDSEKAPNWSDLGAHFASPELARQLLEKMRWPNGAACPHCGGADPYTITPGKSTKARTTRKGLYKCRACRKQFTVTVGTVFEDSHIPINKWMQAIYLLCSSKKGISAHQLHRMLGITYKSAWFMAHRLRYAMTQTPLVEKLGGIVEADETYIGGKVRPRNFVKGQPYKANRRGAHTDNKIAVVALVERGGRVRAFPMEKVTAANVHEVINANVRSDAHLMTDESSLYPAIGKHMKAHDAVKHSNNEYVRGTAHTNTVEGFFSLLKRGINGIYHHVGKGHVGRYVDEFSFRYDYRKVTDGERVQFAIDGAEGKRLTYKQPAGMGTAATKCLAERS